MSFRALVAFAGPLAFAAVASSAWAQTAPAPAAMPKVPANTCGKPEIPGSLASNSQISTFNRQVKVYDECLKQYVESTKALSQAAVDAGNKAVEEHNAFISALKAQAEAQKKP
jgi:hypothetical protein